MKKITIIIVFTVICVTLSFGQYASDALRYSSIMQGGTSRANAMSGSFSAIGGDATTIYFNPASMAIYRSTEITVTPGFEFTNSNTKYLGKTNRDFDLGMNINNISFIGTIDNFNFGIVYNKLNNFNENIIIRGNNANNSITDWFASKAKGLTPKQLEDGKHDSFSSAAWNTYLIDPVIDYSDNNTSYRSMFNTYGQEQIQTISRNGYQGEYCFALSGNIDRKLFIGANLGLQVIRFSENKVLQEIDIDDIITNFTGLKLKENLEVTGSGINLKFGFLYSPIDWLRIGVAVHSPTFFNLKENFSYEIEGTTDSTRSEIYFGDGEYRLNSPFRANASAGFIIGNIALINIDYEFLNYSTARLRADDELFTNDNNMIQNKFKAAHNVRLGAEIRILPNFCVRLGSGFYDSPYKETKNNFVTNYSAGVGLKLNNFFYIDLAYTYFNFGKQKYYLYDGYGVVSPLAEITKSRNRLTFTIGFKFGSTTNTYNTDNNIEKDK